MIEWLIEKQIRAAEAHKTMRAAEATHWLIQAQATLERSLQNIRSPDEWEKFEAAVAGLNRRRRARVGEQGYAGVARRL